MIYMISYDIKDGSNAREKVMASIESLGTWCKYLSTTYLVSTSYSDEQVQSIATKNLNPTDAMIICKVSEKRIMGWLPKEQWNWIDKNL